MSKSQISPFISAYITESHKILGTFKDRHPPDLFILKGLPQICGGLMVMDPKYTAFSDYPYIDELANFSNSDQNHPISENGTKFDVPSPGLNFMNVPFDPPDSGSDLSGLLSTLSSEGEPSIPSTGLSPHDVSSDPSASGWSPEGEASLSSFDGDSSDPVLGYIAQMLMEENTEDKPSMYYDPSALSATEKSLHDVLVEQHFPLPNSPLNYINQESPSSTFWGGKIDHGSNNVTRNSTSTGTGTGDFVDNSHWDGDVGAKFSASSLQTSFPGEYNFHLNMQPVEHDISDELIASSASELVQNMFSNTESVLQFKRGLEEASKFLPSANKLVIDLDSNVLPERQSGEAPTFDAKEEKSDSGGSTNGSSRGKRNHEREDSDLEEGRNNKQSAVHVEETELSEMFDKVLLWNGKAGRPSFCAYDAEKDGECKILQLVKPSNKSNGGKTCAKKRGKKKEMVDLRTLLILCAQAVSANELRTANELLKQIREHSSPSGDGTQRMAHYFANGLEARLAGNSIGVQNFFSSLATRRLTAADILKVYKTLLNSTPLKRFSIFFADRMILHAAGQAATLHIVDFGVLYGYQWPLLIQQLAFRPGGPPKLRITGIELPQRGFRPTERIEETGRRLAKYCERFNVPFEYNPIAAQNWESIPLQDLKIRSDEVLAVNCLTRFKNLHDETDEVNCPRDAVLSLIRKMNPNIFVLNILNGSYNAPFFVSRFREALFHFSSIFDIFDSTLPRDDQERAMLEMDVHGREVKNVLACEGLERVERPETYKQWHGRIMRAGFQTQPLQQKLINKFRAMLKANYHKDFVIDEDNDWMLQGWKGRIMTASSCWLPALESTNM